MLARWEHGEHAASVGVDLIVIAPRLARPAFNTLVNPDVGFQGYRPRLLCAIGDEFNWKARLRGTQGVPGPMYNALPPIKRIARRVCGGFTARANDVPKRTYLFTVEPQIVLAFIARI
jgi:hypothetical protein